MIKKKTFQIIFDQVCRCLPSEWDKLVIYLEYGAASYAYSFYIQKNGKYINGFDIPGTSEKKIADSFKKVDKAVFKDREASKDELWTNMTMIVDANGTMHSDFDYTDLTEDAYEYKKQWKDKYLS
ncbi:MAG: antitoxin YezG family protein [Clostridiales bacterium]|nr:antitoxin YezG family protein [Clostridiales bacterium]